MIKIGQRVTVVSWDVLATTIGQVVSLYEDMVRVRIRDKHGAMVDMELDSRDVINVGTAAGKGRPWEQT